MIFRSRTNRPKTTPSNSGSQYAPIHIKAIDENGYPYLADHGQKDLQQVIDSHYEESRIQTIVSKYQTGDNSVLGHLQGLYADISGQPGNLFDSLNALNKVKSQYNRFSDAVKQKMSFEKFVNALGTDELKQYFVPATNDKPVDKVKPDVNKEDLVHDGDK